MRCWKCKQEMPEGLKYCGNCGVHMNRAVHIFQWLFSKKGLPVLLLLLALLIGGGVWGVLRFVDFPQPELDLPDIPTVEIPFDREETLEKMYDFGVFPDEGSFIAGDTLDGGVFQHQDLYSFQEGGTGNFYMSYNEELGYHEYFVTGECPHWWSHYVFVYDLQDAIDAYLDILDEKPFYLELVHQQHFGGSAEYDTPADHYYHDVGQYYFYHYTGVQNTFGLGLPEFVETELEEINLIIRIQEAGDGIHLEVWQDLGLESIYQEELEDILNDVPYHRTVDDAIVIQDGTEKTEPTETEPAATEPPATEPTLSLMVLPNFMDSCKEGDYTLSSATDYYDYSTIVFRGLDVTCAYAAEDYVRELEKLGYTIIDKDEKQTDKRYVCEWYLSSDQLPENVLLDHSPCHVYVRVQTDTEYNTCWVDVQVMMGIRMDGHTTGLGDLAGSGNCWTCGGDGRCNGCGGDGKVMKWLPGTLEYVEVNCTSCNGGSCRDCGGDGDK